MDLVILAAGMGSRFGGLKQAEPIDKNGNFIIDFSIYDAIKSGFNKVIFVIKEENLPKKPPVTHMRLIIGFNNSTREIIYTDCGGKGHEFKTMPFDQAWAITLAAYTISVEK